MQGLILGLLSGAGIGGLWLLWWLLIDHFEPYVSFMADDEQKKKVEASIRRFKALKIAVIVSAVAIFICGGPTGISLERHDSRKWCDRYSAYKSTLESSLSSESLTGLERIELVSRAADTNAQLAEKQYSCRQWYGFGYDKIILELEPINFD